MKTFALIITLCVLLVGCSSQSEDVTTTDYSALDYNVQQITLSITGMSCQGCVQTVKETIAKHEHVTSVNVTLEDEVAEFLISSNSDAEVALIISDLQSAGYGAILIKNETATDS